MSLTKVAVIRRGPIEWDRNKLPQSELENRIALLKELAGSQGLAGVLVYGNSLKPGNLCYFTNYSCHIAWRDGFLLLPVSGEPLLLLKVPARDVPYIQNITPVKVKACGNLGLDMLRLLKEKGMGGGGLGFVGGNDVPYTVISELRSDLPVLKWIDLTPEVFGWRTVKTAVEQHLIKDCAELTVASMACIRDKAVPGRSLQALEAEVDYLARKMGCEDIQLLVAVNGSEAGPVSSYILKQGDYLNIILSTQILRYWSSICRTLVVGGHIPEKEILAAKEFQKEMLKILRPGNFQKEALRTFAGRVAGKIGLGSSIGLELEEKPCFSAGNLEPLEGMALILRISTGTGVRRVLYGDTVLLKKEQPVLLTELAQ